MQVEIISTTHFTINGKTVYKKDGCWYANPHLTTTEENNKANEIIKKLQAGATVVTAKANLPKISS